MSDVDWASFAHRYWNRKPALLSDRPPFDAATTLAMARAASEPFLLGGMGFQRLPGARFFVGVQWHPEELAEYSQPMRRLFESFVGSAQR